MAATVKVLGIDLGTTNSCMAAILDGELTVIPNRENEKTTPSVVGFVKDGQMLVGRPAKRQAAMNPKDTVFSVKRFMGMKRSDASVERDSSLVPFAVSAAPNGDAWVEAGGRHMSPPEVSAMILQKLRADAEAYLGEAIEQAVITVPAYFSDAQRQATKDAGKIAGFDVLRIVNEPTAASLATGLDHGKDLNIAVYDLGGGTLDVTILQMKNGLFEVKATNGDTHLGGDDFDQAIIRLLMEEFKKSEGIDLEGNKVAIQRLKEAAEAAKHELSSQLQAEISLPFLAMDASGPRHLVYSLSRDRFNEVTAKLVQATLTPCEKALADARLSKGQIQEVILVGGMTRVPEIRRRVEQFFGRPPHPGVDPDEAVAVGAAIQGGILKGQVRDKLLLDVTPLSLGVRVQGGLFSRLIDKNTTIPTRKTSTYTTANDNQTSVRISVYQGENPLASDNIFLGDFEMLGIKPAPRGVPQVDVSFDIDANGIIRVRAQDKDTKQVQQIRIEPNSGLSDEQLASMVAAAREQSSINKSQSEAGQYRLTCQKLVEECRREMELPGLTEAVDRPALGAQLAGLEGRLENADLNGLKDALKVLNQMLLQMRLGKRQGAAGGQP